MGEENKRGCFKQGALGCVVLLGVGLIVMLGFGGLALLDSRRPTERVQEGSSATVPAERRPAVATPEQIADARTDDALDVASGGTAPRALAGTLELDLAMGEFTLVPSDGEQIELEGEFDKTRYELEGTMKEDEDGAWRYVVRFGSRSRILPPTGEGQNRVTIHVPRNLPLRIAGKIRMGESNLELGGLDLRSVKLAAEMGEHGVTFSEPTPEPIESFELRGRMGGLRVAGSRECIAAHGRCAAPDGRARGWPRRSMAQRLRSARSLAHGSDANRRCLRRTRRRGLERGAARRQERPGRSARRARPGCAHPPSGRGWRDG